MKHHPYNTTKDERLLFSFEDQGIVFSTSIQQLLEFLTANTSDRKKLCTKTNKIELKAK